MARLLFRDRLAALWSAAILSLTPANVIISRQALDSVCQLPFTLGFLWCLGKYLQTPQPRLALAAGAILGLGIYAYVTSIVFMPFFLAVFWLIAWRAGVLDRRAWLWSMRGLPRRSCRWSLAAVPSGSVDGIREQYNRADPGSATLMETIASGGMPAAAREFIRIYWSYFDPSFLFVQGGNARNLSTGEVGVFLAGRGAGGSGDVAAADRREVQWLVIICLLAAPIPAAIKGAPYQIQRASGLLIFVSLAAGIRIRRNVGASRRTAARALAVALALVMAGQFAGFYRDISATIACVRATLTIRRRSETRRS